MNTPVRIRLLLFNNKIYLLVKIAINAFQMKHHMENSEKKKQLAWPLQPSHRTRSCCPPPRDVLNRGHVRARRAACTTSNARQAITDTFIAYYKIPIPTIAATPAFTSLQVRQPTHGRAGGPKAAWSQSRREPPIPKVKRLQFSQRSKYLY